MGIAEAKVLIDNDLKLSDGARKKAAVELRAFLEYLIDLADRDFGSQGVRLANSHSPMLPDQQIIVLQNIFQLHYLLKIPLMVEHCYGSIYQVQAIYDDHTFVELVNQRQYDEIYKGITTMVIEHEVFNPYTH